MNGKARDLQLGQKVYAEIKTYLERIQPIPTTYHMEKVLWPEVKTYK